MNDWMDVASLMVMGLIDRCTRRIVTSVVDRCVSLWGLSPWLVERFVGHCMKWVTSMFVRLLIAWEACMIVGRWMKWASRLVCLWPWSDSMVSGRFQLHRNPSSSLHSSPPSTFFSPFLPFLKPFFPPVFVVLFDCVVIVSRTGCLTGIHPKFSQCPCMIEFSQSDHHTAYHTWLYPHLIPALP